MALRKPIVATGTSQYYVKDFKTGYLVPSNSVEQMTNRLLDLIYSPNKRKLMGNAGYNMVKQMCDLNEYRKAVYAIYQNITTPQK